jgi:hypothetical protein
VDKNSTLSRRRRRLGRGFCQDGDLNFISLLRWLSIGYVGSRRLNRTSVGGIGMSHLGLSVGSVGRQRREHDEGQTGGG